MGSARCCGGVPSRVRLRGVPDRHVVGPVMGYLISVEVSACGHIDPPVVESTEKHDGPHQFEITTYDVRCMRCIGMGENEIKQEWATARRRMR